MSKIDELIEWNESHAMYYTDNDVVKQTCRDTAAALRDLRDRLAAAENVVEEARAVDEAYMANRPNHVMAAVSSLHYALAAYPPKPASERTT